MERVERFYRIEFMLRCRRWVPIKAFLEELEISKATFKRDLDYMRARMNVPIEWDRERGGYCLVDSKGSEAVHELPGLWFSAPELYALLAAHRLFSGLDHGLLSSHLEPLVKRITSLLDVSGEKFEVIKGRIRLLTMGSRRVEPAHFATLAGAVLERRRLCICAWNRNRDEVEERVVSPQRLVHYRDNWYLDAWCHWREGLRSFSADTVRSVKVLAEPAMDLDDKVLDEHYATAYGIFAGEPKEWAVLRFSPERARWVREEMWHPSQVGENLADGGYRLKMPYSDERELLMDILRHGSQVVVERPDSLRLRVLSEAGKIADRYKSHPKMQADLISQKTRTKRSHNV